MYAIRADLIFLGAQALCRFESGHRHQIRRAFRSNPGSPFFVAGAGWGHCDVSSMHFSIRHSSPLRDYSIHRSVIHWISTGILVSCHLYSVAYCDTLLSAGIRPVGAADEEISRAFN